MIEKHLNTIIKGDCIEVLKTLPKNSINVIFADPPYNLALKRKIDSITRAQGETVELVNDDWDKFSSFEDYDQFSKNWLTECRRILKPHGTIWVSGTHHNIFRIGKLIQDMGFWILNDIVWVKTNPLPHLLARRFCASHETLIWAVKEQGANFTFNYQALKSLNGEAQMRSDWRIPICQGKERLKINGKKAHSTQKPEALLYRVILSSSKEGDIILDPFFGTGTTGAVAKLLSRKYIGIEQRQDYKELAEERISHVIPISGSAIRDSENHKKLEVPFGALLEKNMIKTGSFLFSPCGNKKARVLPNGELRFKRMIGSIHKISVLASGMDGMSGWNYWHIKLDKKLYEIGLLREIYNLVFNSLNEKLTRRTYPIYLYKLSKIGGFLSEVELENLKKIILSEYEHLNKKERRNYARKQANLIGWGGQSFVSKFLGMSRTTVRKSI